MPPPQMFRLFPWLTRLVTLWTLLAFLSAGCPLWAANLAVSGETTQTEPFGTTASWNQLTGTGNLLETGEGRTVLDTDGVATIRV